MREVISESETDIVLDFAEWFLNSFPVNVIRSSLPSLEDLSISNAALETAACDELAFFKNLGVAQPEINPVSIWE